jgi:hypothetical protein
MQRFFEHAQGEGLVPPMRTNLGHQEHAIAEALQAVSHPNFSLPAMIFPTVVEECNPAIHRLPNEPYRGATVRRISKMMPAESYRRDLDVVAAELSKRNRITTVRHRVLPSSIPGIAFKSPTAWARI